MDKKTVIGILKDDKQDKRNKFSMLLMALNQAPVKNFALTAHYNRAGYSEKNLSAIEYDVKQAFSISAGDLRSFAKTEAKTAKPSKVLTVGKVDSYVDLFKDLEDLDSESTVAFVIKAAEILELEIVEEQVEQASDETLDSFLEKSISFLENREESDVSESKENFLNLVEELQSLFPKEEKKEGANKDEGDPGGKTEQLELEKYNEQLKAIDTEKADYQEMVSLAYDLAEQLNIELPNKKKSTVVAFLEEQKKSLANEA